MFILKLLTSVIMPALLVYIGFRGIKPDQRRGALRVILIMVGVMVAATAVYIVVMIEMTPKWVASDCAESYEELAASDKTFAREPFMAGCNNLSIGAAECTKPSFAKKFPDHCKPYVGEIHAQLPTLDLGIAH